MDLTPDQGRVLLDEARRTIRRALEGRVELEGLESGFDPPLLQPAGCFVTLHTLGGRRLRGCVGRLEATHPLIEAVRAMAGGVLEDPRFVRNPVCRDELCDLEIEISVISPLRPAAHPLDFDLAEHGIYLKIESRAGCFLPQVARETGWGREQLLDRLCVEKMGFAAGRWRQPGAVLSVFTSRTIGPEPFATPASMSRGAE